MREGELPVQVRALLKMVQSAWIKSNNFDPATDIEQFISAMHATNPHGLTREQCGQLFLLAVECGMLPDLMILGPVDDWTCDGQCIN